MPKPVTYNASVSTLYLEASPSDQRTYFEKGTYRIPPRHGLEAGRAAARVRTVGNVVQDLRVLVQDGVDEADGALARVQALVVDASNNRGEDGRRGGGAAEEGEFAFVVDLQVEAWQGSASVVANE